MIRPRAFRTISLLVLGVAAARAGDFEIEPDQVLISAQAALGDKQVSAVSRTLEWTVLALGERGAQFHLRVPLDSFDSGHPQLDLALREALECNIHPAIDLEGRVADGRFTGVLRVRGVSRPLAMPVDLTRSGTRIVAHTAFEIDLGDFGVSIPQVGRRLSVEFLASLRASQAALSGGARPGS